ncbi:MAG: alpha/beta hydrolase [Deltaproteobacteria bacterium]
MSLFRSVSLITLLIMIAVSGCRGGASCSGNGQGTAGEYRLEEKPETFSYVEGGTKLQRLDLYRLKGVNGPRPALVWIHGGGWIRGIKENVDPIAFDMASIGGYQIISVDYRYAGDESAPWPEIVFDIKAAIRWIKIHAEELGVDPGRIILAGESAGAHLAALAAVTTGVTELEGTENPGVSMEVSAAVLFFAPYNMATLAEEKRRQIEDKNCMKPGYSSPALELLDCPDMDKDRYNVDGCRPEDIELADPATHLDASDPPMYVAHGTGDCVVPWTESKAFADALTEASIRHEFVTTEGGVHRISSLNVNAGEIVEFVEAGR